MSPVRIVTDSTGAPPAAVCARYGIGVVPLHVVFGQDTYRDGIDLTPEEFYRKLAAYPGRVGTAQPTPADFCDAFETAGQFGSEVLCLTISGKLSGTVNAARQAAELATETNPGLHVHVLDTRLASAGHALLTVAAAEWASAGAAPADIITALEALREHVHLYALVDTLDYLIRGGRVGRARGLVGKLLGLHPLLTLEDGEVASPGVVRGRAAGLARIEEEATRRLTGKGRRRFVVVHANVPAEARRWAAHLKERFAPDDLWIEPFTPVIGVHGGPGLLGLIFCEMTDSPTLPPSAPPETAAGPAGADAPS